MNIVVLNRAKAEEFTSDVPWVAISIICEGDFPKLSKENRLAICKVAFWDTDVVVRGQPRMTECQAEEILKFADEYWDKVETLLIHCDAGRSRSPAVAAALSRIKVGHDDGYFNSHIPNRWVYGTLLKVNETRRRQDVVG